MDKDHEAQVISLIKEMKDTVETRLNKTDSELKEQLEKMGGDITELQRKVSLGETEKATVEKELGPDGKPLKIEVHRKDVFKGRDVNKVSGLGSIYKRNYIDTVQRNDNLNLRKLLYMPRSDWSPVSRSYVRVKGYDGLDDVMELNDIAYFSALAIAHKTKQSFYEVIKGLDSFNMLNGEIQSNTELTKALDTADGSDFIPTQFSARLLDDVRLQLRVAALFPRLPLPRSPFTTPIKGSRIVAYLVGEATTDGSAKIPTSDPLGRNITFTAIKFAVRTLFSDEFAEDSIVPVMPWVRSELVQAMADAEEDACLNGDATDSTHIHSDVTSANDRRKAYDGLLYHSGQSSGNAAVDISTINTANLRSIRKKMGRFGASSNRLAWITSISGYIQMLGLTEVLTIDKFGPKATVVSGELAKFDGAPVIVSEFSRSDLNTSGVYDGATTTDTNILLVHTPSFLFGDVGPAKAEADRDIETLQTIVVTHRRTSFEQVHSPGSGEETVGIGYSLTA